MTKKPTNKKASVSVKPLVQASSNPSTLIKEVNEVVRHARTRSFDITLNELVAMKTAGEFVIDPSYQRSFRWELSRQSQFMESLILELPIPPIYVMEREDSKLELIDGLQRISSYLNFRGEFKAPKDSPKRPASASPYGATGPFPLIGCEILPGLNGVTFEKLPPPVQLRLKRAFIRVEMVRKEAPTSFRYHVFKRLNTGGLSLSDQEVRNCTIRILNPKFNDFIQGLSNNKDFRKCMKLLSPEEVRTMGLEELVLRMLAFKNAQHLYRHDIAPFLTAYMEAVTSPELATDGFRDLPAFDYDSEEDSFEKTFRLLGDLLGEEAFSPSNGVNIEKRFAVLMFEAVTLGIQKYVPELVSRTRKDLQRLRVQIEAWKATDEVRKRLTGGGKNSRSELAKRVELLWPVIDRFLGKGHRNVRR